MMLRLLLILLVAAAVAGALVVSGADGDGTRRYWVELDNAFGLVEGGDVKVAGVRAGKVRSFRIDRRTYHGLVEIELPEEGFADLRADVFCEVRPQSLIGEYFLDCKPGKSSERLGDGARIPVARTASSIPLDLIQNIMRRPYRERFSIILGELGAALAARGADLNEVIRRASPTLRELNKVLAALSAERRTIRDLTENAERVVGRLADKRREVGRFVREAADTQGTVAQEIPALREQLRTLPTFLRELRPTMARLESTARDQAPALDTLADNARLFERFLDELTGFTRASRPSFRTLAGAARPGRQAVRAAAPRVPELAAFARQLPEVADNAAIVLEHLDDRDHAVEPNRYSPGGKGYTGLETLLHYIFRQSQAINVYDANSFLLKVALFLDNPCAGYTDAKQIKSGASPDRCRAWLGPNQQGITVPDPTATATPARARARAGDRREDARPAATAPVPPFPGAPAPPSPGAPPAVDGLTGMLQKLTGARDLAGAKALPEQSAALLDYLLGP